MIEQLRSLRAPLDPLRMLNDQLLNRLNVLPLGKLHVNLLLRVEDIILLALSSLFGLGLLLLPDELGKHPLHRSERWRIKQNTFAKDLFVCRFLLGGHRLDFLLEVQLLFAPLLLLFGQLASLGFDRLRFERLKLW